MGPFLRKICRYTQCCGAEIIIRLRGAEVGKMKIFNRLPLSLSSTHVGDIVYLKKKGRIVRFLLTTLVLWKSRGKGRDVFFIESEKFDP